MESKKFYHKKDLLVIGAILVTGLALLLGYRAFFYDVPPKVEIYVEDRLAKSFSLRPGREETFSLEGKERVKFHVYQEGAIAFVESDCPDKVCIHSGKLCLAGQSAACLPNGVILKLVAEKGGEEGPDVII